MNASLATCLLLCLTCVSSQSQYYDPHFWQGRTTIVHLFEWKWNDIADECERFLQYKRFAGVQISPPNENLVVTNRPWWERYQPVSYKLKNRSGDEKDFLDMTKRCNAVGVRIYVDVVFNHMTGKSGTGTAGNPAYYSNTSFPAVSYTQSDFNKACSITNYQDPINVRNCRLVELADLDQSVENVKQNVINFLNQLIELGAAGFRIDAAKHMWPADLAYIYSKLDNLNVDFGFSPCSRPFIYQEVIDYGGEGVSKYEYIDLGAVIEFKFSGELNNAFRGNNKLTYLESFGPSWGLIPSNKAISFIDNHDNQRDGFVLTYKKAKKYKMAIAFMLAHPYGTPRIISSYMFDYKDQGPPADPNGNLISPSIKNDSTCGNGYVCEHRWRQIFNMVEFRNVVHGTAVAGWWSDGNQKIAFCRGDKGFIVFTNGGDVERDLQTCLPPGTYCDVISGEVVHGKCTGKAVTVGADGVARILLGAMEEDGVLAIHVNAKILLS